MMNILALDLATKTGWACPGSGHRGAVLGGVWNCSVRRDESNGMRLIRLRGKLNWILEAIRPVDLVVFEGARHAAPHMQGALTVTAELVSVVKVWCHDNGLEYRAYSPSEIKRHATGKGNCGKDAMTASAKAKWPQMEIIDDNHADALWLLDLAQAEYGEKNPFDEQLDPAQLEGGKR